MNIGDWIQFGMFIVGFIGMYLAFNKQFNRVELYVQLDKRVALLEQSERMCGDSVTKELDEIKSMIGRLFDKVDKHIDKART